MANEIAKRLMARVRTLREARDLTQEKFAERAGLQYKHYQAMEAGRRLNIQFATLQKIAKGLGLELKELFDFDASAFSTAEAPAAAYDARPDPPPARRSRSVKARTKRKP